MSYAANLVFDILLIAKWQENFDLMFISKQICRVAFLLHTIIIYVTL